MASIFNVLPPQAVINARRNGVQSATAGASLIYPSDIGIHFMLLIFKEYSRTKQNRETIVNKGSIALPIPQNLVEQHTARYSAIDAAPAGGAVLENAANAIRGSNVVRELAGQPNQTVASVLQAVGVQTGDVLKGAFQSATDNVDLGRAAASFAGRTLGTGAGAAIEAMSGYVLNPHTISTFQGIPLRQHRFTWRFAPKTEKDSSTLNSIFQKIRSHMLPSRRGTFFLEYPDEVDVVLGGTTKEFAMPFKTCMIENVSLNRMAGGPAFFRKTGAPVMLDLEISLIEMEAFIRDDFSSLPTGELNSKSGPGG